MHFWFFRGPTWIFLLVPWFFQLVSGFSCWFPVKPKEKGVLSKRNNRKWVRLFFDLPSPKQSISELLLAGVHTKQDRPISFQPTMQFWLLGDPTGFLVFLLVSREDQKGGTQKRRQTTIVGHMGVSFVLGGRNGFLGFLLVPCRTKRGRGTLKRNNHGSVRVLTPLPPKIISEVLLASLQNQPKGVHTRTQTHVISTNDWWLVQFQSKPYHFNQRVEVLLFTRMLAVLQVLGATLQDQSQTSPNFT